MTEEFWRDGKMDAMIKDIIDIFTQIEGVELVRLSGLTRRARKISEMEDLPEDRVDSIVKKFKFAGLLNYTYITKCPQCGEVSYHIKPSDNMTKVCDTCKVFYTLEKDKTLFLDN